MVLSIPSVHPPPECQTKQDEPSSVTAAMPATMWATVGVVATVSAMVHRDDQ